MKAKSTLPILGLQIFLVMVGFGIIIPVLPFYARDLGANPTELGWLMAVYSAMQLIFSPVWGRISDNIGRKPVMMIGISGLALSFFLMAVATDLWMLFVARIIGGILSSANMPTASAYVADITTPENRSKGMGIIGAAAGLGFIVGPAIGGIFSKISLRLPFIVAGVSSLITIVLVLFLLKESLPREMRERIRDERPSRFEGLRGPNSFLFLLQFFISFSLAGLEATFAYFGAARAGLGSTEIGYIFMIMGLASAFVQGGLMGPLAKRFGEGAIIQGGVIISALGFGLILLTESFLTAAIFLSIFGLGNGVIRPALTALLTKSAGKHHGNVTGLLSSFDSLGRIVGPPVGGALFEISIGLPYLSGIVLSFVAFGIYLLYKVKAQTVKEKERHI